MATAITIRRIEEPDFAQADAVLRAAFEQPYSFLPNLHVGRAIEPDGLLLAEDCGTIVGTVGAVNYGALAYVGFMSVKPSHQRRGIGRLLMKRLLDWLDACGCPIVLLDATPKGAALYESLGFVDDHEAFVFERERHVKPSAGRRAGDGAPHVVVQPAGADELNDIAALDARSFGADRHKLLAALWPEHRDRCFMARDRNGRLVGYLTARDPVLGPWVAESVDAAEALLSSAMSSSGGQPRGRAPLVMVPRSNRRACELLAQYGFSQRRCLRHMRRGGSGPPGALDCLYGQASFAHG